jgi:hypothetical protein
MSSETRAFVRRRAQDRCEDCQLHQDDSPLATLHVEHIIPKSHGGKDDMENLALACIDCNLNKRPNLTGIDPRTSRITNLFNPRLQRWDDHFEWKAYMSLEKQQSEEPQSVSSSLILRIDWPLDRLKHLNSGHDNHSVC